VEVDWGDGEYERIAAELMPTAEVLLDAVGAATGSILLDVGCGTGNVAIAAAARGASATGVDPSVRLVELARARAAREGIDARFVVGDASHLPAADAEFDAAVSAFGVIFAPDPARSVAEMLRVTRRGGVIGLTSWLPSGAVFEAGRVLRQALPADEAMPPWDDPDWIRELLTTAGATGVEVTTAEIAFTAPSPDAWLTAQVEHHPAWRAARSELGPGAWDGVRGRMLDRLGDGNEDPAAFRATSGYLVVVAGR